MWIAQDFTNIVAESSAEADRIAVKLQPPPPHALTPEEEEALYAALAALRDKLKSL